MYEEGSESGNKGSFENFKAEGDVLFKQQEYNKALESFSTALELRPGDQNCLIARSQCHLALGSADKALEDAEEILKDDKTNIKGMLQKAEALYQQGNFEMALVFYQRGKKLRPEMHQFRLGIQKSQEAIDNSVGDAAGIKLENKGDLKYFYEEQQKQNAKSKKGKQTYGRPAAKKDDKKDQKRQKNKTDKKTLKQLLGELYADQAYLENLLEETENNTNTETNESVKNLAENCLKYLDSRTEFWQQQKPMYAREHEKRQKEERRGKSGKGKKDPTDWILKNLEEIDAAQAKGEFEKSLKQAKRVLKDLNDDKKWSEDSVKNKPEVVANLHSCIGNSYLEMGEYQKSLEHHTVDLEIAEEKGIEDAKSRALDNLGRVYARMGKFEKAIEVWENKLPMSKSALESTWLYHEIGRCHLEVGNYKEAQDYGEKSLKAAQEADDKVWQLNASVLMAQSQVKSGDNKEALDTFEHALDMAKAQDDKAAESAIKKAIDDVNAKITKQLKEDQKKAAEKPKKLRKKLTEEERKSREDKKAAKAAAKEAKEKEELERKKEAERIRQEEEQRRLAEEEERKRLEDEKKMEKYLNTIYPDAPAYTVGVQTVISAIEMENVDWRSEGVLENTIDSDRQSGKSDELIDMELQKPTPNAGTSEKPGKFTISNVPWKP